MDRTTPILLSASAYTFLGWLNYQLTPCPSALLAKDKQKEYRDFYGQHVSLLHSVIAVIFSVWLYLQDGGVLYESPMSQDYLNVLGHSLGYFTYDMIYAELYGVHDWPMRMHHFSAIVAGFIFYLDPKGGSIAICEFPLSLHRNSGVFEPIYASPTHLKGLGDGEDRCIRLR